MNTMDAVHTARIRDVAPCVAIIEPHDIRAKSPVAAAGTIRRSAMLRLIAANTDSSQKDGTEVPHRLYRLAATTLNPQLESAAGESVYPWLRRLRLPLPAQWEERLPRRC